MERFLLPKTNSYLLSFTDLDLISTVRDFLLEPGVIHSPIHQEHEK